MKSCATLRVGAAGRTVGVAILATLATWVLRPLAAPAAFGPIELQSVGPFDQAEAAGEPVISADGHYLAFEGTLDGVEGVFRKDLRSDRIELVAGGSVYAPGGAAVDASAPSIGADGRYVSFDTRVALDPLDDTETGSSVYVRDMSLAMPATADGVCTPAEVRAEQRPCAYTLASALDGSRVGLTYEGSGSGALASGRVALSADGREVVFVVQGASNLTSEANGSTPGVPTPGPQVAVRYLDTQRTVLASTERDPLTGQMTQRPVPGGAVTPTTQIQTSGQGQLAGASLSADGTTVAWLGAHIPAQVPLLSDEAKRIEQDDEREDSHYDEPLWRRIADGPAAPTQRILGGGDPLAPGCPSDGTLALAACRGPLPELASELRGGEESYLGWLGIRGYDGVPQLSQDGLTVALIGDPGATSNVFVVDMRPGLDRVQALRRLTREVPVANVTNPGTQPAYVASAGDVYDIAISPDGQRIAFTTQRQQFPLAPPNFTEPPLSQLGAAELYEIDLGAESIRRVTHGPGDGPSLAGPVIVTSAGAAAPSFTSAGELAFADTASNLVSGDANGASDVFTVTDSATPPVPGPVEIGPSPPAPSPLRPWRMSVVAFAHADGSVTLDVVVPGAGRLAASATAAVPVSIGVSARRSTGSTRSGRRPRRAARVALKTRVLATARRSSSGGELLDLRMRVAKRYASLLATPAGIYATVRVSFTSAAGPPLARTLAVSLHKIAARPRGTAKSKRHRVASAAQRRGRRVR